MNVHSFIAERKFPKGTFLVILPLPFDCDKFPNLLLIKSQPSATDYADFTNLFLEFRLFGIKWGEVATERTETFEKKLKNSFSL